jgi:hypothetical protein
LYPSLKRRSLKTPRYRIGQRGFLSALAAALGVDRVEALRQMRQFVADADGYEMPVGSSGGLNWYVPVDAIDDQSDRALEPAE